jgi:hypothetical protein
MTDLSREHGLFKAENLTSAAYVAGAVIQMLQHLGELGISAPPLPPNPAGLAPCNIHVSEGEGPAGERMGRIRFVKDNGAELFHREWLIAAAE